MKLSHVQALRAPREKVFAALTDPATLQACVEGCESLTPAGPDAWDARLKVGLGPIRGTYKGRLEIRDRVPPESLSLIIEGRGLAGSVRCEARVTLLEKDGGTELRGDGEAKVGGLLAAFGPSLAESAAKGLLVDFFTKLAARL